jgi:pimeloyl-ACP methyl ester carboxylesterase
MNASSRLLRCALQALSVAAAVAGSSLAQSQIKPVLACDAEAVGAVKLTADAPVTVIDVSTGIAGSGEAPVPYCLVKLRVPAAINVWVGLPLEGKWNGRLQSVGGGGYAGTLTVPAAALADGYVGVVTDTGHAGADGTFGMAEPGRANTPLWIDFAYRSEHLMAVLGKQLIQAFYGQAPAYSYWNGCSTGGRQGLMMAQRFPQDYNGILAGAPAIHWDRFQAAQIWPQVAMLHDAGGAIAMPKLVAANKAAVDACDAQDGVVDGVLEEPRACKFDASQLVCKAGDTSATCLTAGEASAINKIWQGPRGHWYGLTRGSAMNTLAGPRPFMISIAQPRYWVYLDPTWDWHTLDYRNYGAFFEDSVKRVGPIMSTDNPDLAAFRQYGGKLIMWHGWSDPGIMPEGSVEYYEQVAKRSGGYAKTQDFARLFMAPGVGHCAGGDGPQPKGLFNAVVNWVEHSQAPASVLASKALPDGGTRTRPLCPYPTVAVWKRSGSTDDAANFRCAVPKSARR